MRLSDLKVGDVGVVVGIDSCCDRKIKRRLQDMGMVKSEKIEVKKFAPLKDPIEVLVKGYSLTLRKKEADFIDVELCQNSS